MAWRFFQALFGPVLGMGGPIGADESGGYERDEAFHRFGLFLFPDAGSPARWSDVSLTSTVSRNKPKMPLAPGGSSSLACCVAPGLAEWAEMSETFRVWIENAETFFLEVILKSR